MVALVFFDQAGDPLDADCLPVQGAPTPVHFIRERMKDLGHWPVGATKCKGFYDATQPPIFLDVPRARRDNFPP